MLRTLLELSRISNLPTAWTNVLAAWIIAGGPASPSPALLWLLLAASLIYSGGMMLNDAADATWDRQHKPDRPIPAGRITATAVWAIGSLCLISGAALAILAAGASPLWTLSLLAAILAYDLYHKPWSGSVINMASCRTLLYAMAASAVNPQLSLAVWMAGSVLGLYIVALSLVARGEAKGQLTPATRVCLTALLLLPAVVPAFSHATLLPWLIPGAALTALVLLALRQMKRGGPHIGSAVGWLLAGIPLVDALALHPSAPLSIILALTALPPLLKLWQKAVAAT